VAVHLDGARLFNAEVALGVGASRLAGPATTVMCCLSKGLCAPVGSLLAGPADLMEEARGERQRLGGGMRQAGVLAAAGLVALRTMIERLADDHWRARRLAESVADRWPDAGVIPGEIRTNCVTFRHPRPDVLLDHLRDEGVLAGTIAPGVVRLMTHHDVDDDDVERARKAVAAAPGNDAGA
jgi:threonine aldolase